MKTLQNVEKSLGNTLISARPIFDTLHQCLYFQEGRKENLNKTEAIQLLTMQRTRDSCDYHPGEVVRTHVYVLSVWVQSYCFERYIKTNSHSPARLILANQFN